MPAGHCDPQVGRSFLWTCYKMKRCLTLLPRHQRAFEEWSSKCILGQRGLLQTASGNLCHVFSAFSFLATCKCHVIPMQGIGSLLPWLPSLMKTESHIKHVSGRCFLFFFSFFFSSSIFIVELHLVLRFPLEK